MKAAQVAKNAGQVTKCIRYAQSSRQGRPRQRRALLADRRCHRPPWSALAPAVPLGGREVYWLAADYYQRAKSVDSSCGVQGQHQDFNQVKRSYPTIDDLFTYGITAGKEIKVECLNETTTARQP